MDDRRAAPGDCRVVPGNRRVIPGDCRVIPGVHHVILGEAKNPQRCTWRRIARSKILRFAQDDVKARDDVKAQDDMVVSRYGVMAVRNGTTCLKNYFVMDVRHAIGVYQRAIFERTEEMPQVFPSLAKLSTR